MRRTLCTWTAIGLCFLQSLTASAIVFTNDTAIGPYNTNYEGQSIVISNCTVTVDGPHTFASLRLASGATLTHSAASNGAVNVDGSVTNEPHVLDGTNAVPLLESNVYPALVVVRDVTGTVTYSSTVDYVLSSSPPVALLERTPSSTIPDGATVLVSYLYSEAFNAGLILNISADLEVESGASIEANGRGFDGNLGPGNGAEGGSPLSGGGGSHGGSGGLSSSNSLGGPAYGDVFAPFHLGSGGGTGTGGPGGAGGGVIRLVVGGNAHLNGVVSADGANASLSRSGGGSGGSIWISAQAVLGSGMITANGGAGEPIHGGGGGGGRIAIEFATNLFTGTVSAFGGPGWQRGGAGTAFLRTNSTPGRLVLDNGSFAGAATPLDITNGIDLAIQGGAIGMASGSAASPLTVGNLKVGSGSLITTSATNNSTLMLTVQGDATIEPGASISMNRKGYPRDQGPGMGMLSGGGVVGSGAGHGGFGGDGILGSSIAVGGNAYGSVASPISFGSGGRGLFPNFGGEGGGLIRLIVSGELRLDGLIAANAGNGSGLVAGGGSGGSIWLVLGRLSGSGLVTAHGGSGGLPYGGGGGGGRIAILAETNSFTGSLLAHGGVGAVAGGAGTIYIQANSSQNLLVDNGGLSGTNTLSNIDILDLVTVAGGARLQATFSRFGALTVASNSALVLGNGSAFTISRDVLVDAGGAITGDGLILSGSGAGQTTSQGSGGGGHAGYGGRGFSGFGGNAYGNATSPLSSGSPGGGATSPFGLRGLGGSGFHLTVQGNLVLNGKISSNGGNASTNNAGGGSGGSVWLTVLKEFTGSGSVTANGGSGGLNSGGGGGGRIAIYYTSNSFTGQIVARGGPGFAIGGAGTIYLKPLNNSLANFFTDNGGAVGTNTLAENNLSTANVTIGPGAILALTPSSANFNNLTILSNAMLQASNAQSLTVASNLAIAVGGKLSCDAVSRGAEGTASGNSSAGAGGGGHAGRGGDGAGVDGTGRGGSPFLSETASNPFLPGGSGGGINLSGGTGGGRLNLVVHRLLRVDGILSANGQSVSGSNAGGGAGGSLLLTVGGLTGSGIISADGGSGHLPFGGGGGGGRIAIYYASNTFSGIISAKGGPGFIGGGAGTLYFKPTTNNVATVLVDNGSLQGTNTVVSVTSGSFDLTLQNGAVATTIGSPRDLLIRSNAWLRQAGAIVIGRNATIEQGGGINLDVMQSGGMVKGPSSQSRAGGGAHAGQGGLAFIWNTYGSAISPTNDGSAGGDGLTGGTGIYRGGYGGGALRLTLPGTLLNNGRISANGGIGTLHSGGGSGGSLWLTVGTLAGTGQITARGGSGGSSGSGGGGGGRIALNYNTNLFAGVLSACGGAGFGAGGAGTIYTKANSEAGGTLVLGNCGLSGTDTPLSQITGLATNIQVVEGAVAEVTGRIPPLDNLLLASGGRMTIRQFQTNLYLAVAGDVTIDASSSLDVNGKGHSMDLGPGAGSTLSNQGSGGGYGGPGGESASGAPGGTNYGSATQPTDIGSGGGLGLVTFFVDSEGAGALRLNVGGTLLIDGHVAANGNDASQDDAGGGSGGSLWITAARVTGAGAIRADGGDGELFGGGGGGGGRIALYSPMNTFTGLVSTAGGIGAFPGGTGTVHITSTLLPLQVVSQSPVGLQSNAVSQVDLEFSAPISIASLSAADITIVTPYGIVGYSNIAFSFPAPATLRVSFPPQNAVGDYALQVGPAIEDLLGQPMIQAYSGSFSIALPLISGTVTNTNGQPIFGVMLQPSGGLSPALSDPNGNYALGVPPGWSGTVTPTSHSLMFVPGARSYTNVQANIVNQDYLLVPTIAPSVQFASTNGDFGLRWYGIGGVTYQAYWSTNFANWYLLGAPSPGSNAWLELLIPIGSEPAKFFRISAQN